MGPKRRGASSAPTQDEITDNMSIEERRSLQNRLAQRAFRERKDNRIRELEAQVADLQMQLGLIQGGGSSTAEPAKPNLNVHLPPEPSPQNCVHCAYERGRSAALSAQVSMLQQDNSRLSQLYSAQVAAMQSLIAPWNPIVPNTIQTPSSSSSSSSSLNHQQSQVHPLLQRPQMTHPMLFSALTKNDWEKAMADSPNESRNSSETSSGTAAELLYGPLQISNSREALKSLPSIRGTQAMQYVDDMSDAFLAQSKSSSGKEIRKQVIRLLYSRTKILDACSPIDRLKAIEIMEATKNQFKVHMDHMYTMYGSSAPRNNYGCDVRHGSPHGSHSSGGGNNSNNNATGSASPSSAILEVFEETFNKQPLSSHISGPPTPNLKTLKKAMNLVPSLTNHPIIDELCNLFEFQARCTDPEERCETIFKFIDVRNKISDVCKTEEEKMQFHIAMEIGRAENRSLVEEMYRSVESSLQEHERIAGFSL